MDPKIEARLELELYRALKDKYEGDRGTNLAYHRRELARIEQGNNVGDGAIYDAMYHASQIKKLEG